MKFRFKGQDGSLGYIKGCTYNLSTVKTPHYPIVIIHPKYCPYATMQAFYDNWEVVLE